MYRKEISMLTFIFLSYIVLQVYQEHKNEAPYATLMELLKKQRKQARQIRIVNFKVMKHIYKLYKLYNKYICICIQMTWHTNCRGIPNQSEVKDNLYDESKLSSGIASASKYTHYVYLIYRETLLLLTYLMLITSSLNYEESRNWRNEEMKRIDENTRHKRKRSS